MYFTFTVESVYEVNNFLKKFQQHKIDYNKAM